MRKGLSFLVLLLLALSFLASVTSVRAAEKAPIKIDPCAPALMSVTDNKLSVSKWAGFSTVDVEMPQIIGFSDYEYRVYDIPEGKEIDLILYKPPQTNVFYYPITNTKNVQFFYQPPLTSGEVAQGCVRPENVVGSYAVYGTKSNNEYGTGKIMHIYRPKVHDATGSWIWGVLDYKDGVLSVTVDAKWLAGAVYPVTIDPTFGNTNEGGSVEPITADYLYGAQYATPAFGGATVTVTSISVYLGYQTNNINVKMGVWTDSNGGAVISGGLSAAQTTAGTAWYTKAITPTLSGSTNYELAVIGDNTGMALMYDATAWTSHIDTSNSYTTPGNFDWNTNSNKHYSIYVTFTYTPTITSGAMTDLDDTTNMYTMKKNYTYQAVIGFAPAETITDVSVKFVQGATIIAAVKGSTLNVVPAWSITVGATMIDLNTTLCTWVAGTGTAIFKIRAEWDVTQGTTNSYVSALDSGASNSTWIQKSNIIIVSRLVTRDFASSVPSTPISTPFLISGKVRYSMTAAGYNASTSYPPDAQFTAVKVYTDDGDFVGQNTTITNGAFSVNATSISVLGTTAYIAWLDLVPDYTDGYAVDNDVIYVYTEAIFPFVDYLGKAFAAFGLIGAITGTIYTMLFAFAAWFTNAALLMVSLITAIITFIFFVGATIISWFLRITTTLINLLTVIGNLFNGTYTSGIPNIWVLFNVSAWIDAVPIIIVILWLDGIVVRSHRMGRNNFEVMVGDIQVASYIIGEVWSWSYTVFNFVLSTIGQIASRF